MTPLDVELIGLSGYAGAGKDEVAKILADCQWRRASFADPLRAALYALNPAIWVGTVNGNVPLADLVDNAGWDDVKRDYPVVRQLLQRMGTEVGRNLFGADFWVDQALAGIERDGGTRYVFTDVRFPQEFDAIRNRGGRLWRVTRPGVGPVNSHPSETALDTGFEFDATVDNDGTLTDLHDRVLAELTLNYRVEPA